MESKVPPKGSDPKESARSISKKALKNAKIQMIEDVVDDTKNSINSLKKSESSGIPVKERAIVDFLRLQEKIDFSKDELGYSELKENTKPKPVKGEPTKDDSKL